MNSFASPRGVVKRCGVFFISYYSYLAKRQFQSANATGLTHRDILRCFLETGRVFDNLETRVCYTLVTPCEDLLEVPAAMQGAEVGVRLGVAFHPIKGNDPYVSDAHNLLAEHLDAVICGTA